MAYTGIENVNEFYTHHYLTAMMQGELASTFASWRTRDEDSPDRALRALYRPFFTLHEELQHGTPPLELFPPWFATLLGALDYPTDQKTPQKAHTTSGHWLPLLCQLHRHDGAPALWCLGVVTDGDPLEGTLQAPQFDPQALLDPEWHMPASTVAELCQIPMEDLIGQEVFALPEPPRFVLLCGPKHIVLLDRLKWFEKRMLRFDLEELLGRREDDALKAAAALLTRQSLVPHSGPVLLDTMDEASHKHAYGVSTDLKYALRKSIELLGNEAIDYTRRVRRDKVFGLDLGDQLGQECLRYMYRLLFLFYIEARPELGYAPMNSPSTARATALKPCATWK